MYGLVDNIREESITELTDMLIEKFEYFGYSEDDAIETTDIEDDAIETTDIEEDDTQEQVLSNLVGNLLAELYNPTNKTYRLNKKNMQDYAYSKCDKYILLLVCKGIIPEE